MSYSIRNKFIKMPIYIYNKEEAKIIGEENTPSIPTFVMIDPTAIESYRPDESNVGQQKCVCVGLKSGDGYVIVWNIIKFETEIDKFMGLRNTLL